MIRALFVRLRSLIPGRRADADLDEEIRTHIEMAAEEYLARGMSPEAATRAARRDFGGVDQVKERHREARGAEWLDGLLRDLRIGARGLIKRPSTTIAMVATLAIGIGANGAIFSIVDGILFKPLAYPEPSELVVLWEDRSSAGGAAEDDPTIVDVLDWQARSRSFESMTYFWPSFPRMIEGDAVAQVTGAQLSANTLALLGVAPAMGRGFLASETRAGGPAVAIVGHALWESRFGAAPSVVGQTIVLDEVEHLVVGVMPASFRFPRLPFYSETPDVLTPFQRDPSTCQGPNQCVRVSTLGRLAEGVSLERARAELTGIVGSGASVLPGRSEPPRVRAISLRDQTVASFRPFALVLVGMVVLLLLASCANVTNLLLARGEGRANELATRAALGANRTRLLGQLLAEGGLIGVAGGLVALGAALFATPLLVQLLSTVVDLPRSSEMGVDARAIVFLVAVAVAAGMVTATVAGLHATGKVRIGRAATSRGRGTATRGGSGLLRTLTVLQVATAFVLLAGTGLLYQGVQSLLDRERGFQLDDILTVQLPLTGPEYGDRAANLEFVGLASDAIGSMPGVTAVAAASSVPLDGDGGGQVNYRLQSDPVEGAPARTARFRGVTAGYFDVMGIEIVDGRPIATADREDTPRVLVVNEELANREWPGRSPVGETLLIGPYEFEVVGVASNVRSLGLDREESAVLYRPLTQGASDYTTLVVRRADPAALAPTVRAEILRLDPRLAGLPIRTMDEVMRSSVSPQRVTVGLLSILALMALGLSAAGVYGIAQHWITQETPEIGVRMALGASAARVRRKTLSRGITTIGGGLALGLVVALFGSRLLTGLLYGASPWEPVVFIQAAAVLSVIGLVATYFPARRASRLDPVAALKSE